jgi:radical SAM superfamily enzyme YgiQ (UPF0313 family)
MKIVFIDPRGFSDGLNTGLGYLAAVLKEHDVRVVDFNNKRGNEYDRLLAARDADIVGISVKSFTLKESLRLASAVKKINPGAKLVAGGPHITIDGQNFLKDNQLFDIGVYGEGEAAFFEIASGKDPEHVKGVIFRRGGEIVKNESHGWIANLDVLPFPNYEVFDSFDGKIASYPLVTSRGCPYSCTYCSVGNVIGKKWRARSAKNIVDELIQAKEKYRCGEFKILDDDFTLDINRAKEICQRLIDDKVDLRWSCPNGIRADRLDEELVGLMKQSGCCFISLGVESGDPDVFEKIKKGEKLDDVEKAVSVLKAAGIKVHGFFIIGLPGSTYKKDRASAKFGKKVGLDSASFGILVPYPGTEVYDIMSKDTNVSWQDDWKNGFHMGFKPKTVFEKSDYSSKEMKKAYYLNNLSFVKLKQVPVLFKLFVKSMIKV